MFYTLSLLTGILITVMVAVNGALTAQYGIYSATVIIHIIGLTLITAAALAKRDRIFTASGIPWFLYLGGAIGVMTTVFNNLAFGRISVSAIMALGLFGQSVAGLIIDQFGLFGMARHPFSRRKLLGLALLLAGIGVMVNMLEFTAVAVSFAAGVNIVLSRTLNARLSAHTSERVSTFYNYFIGLIVSVFVFLMLGNENILPFLHQPLAISPANWYIYLGGVLGVCVVFVGNITAVKISAFYLTLLIFIGQVFSGIMIDFIILREISARILIGGALVSAGLSANLFLDKANRAKQNG